VIGGCDDMRSVFSVWR